MVKMSHAMRHDHHEKTLRSDGSSILQRVRLWMITISIITMLVASACASISQDQATPSQTIKPTPQAIVPATYTAMAANTLHSMLTPDAPSKPHDTSTPYPTPNGFELSVPVYILSHEQRRVWRLDPQAVALERVTPSDWQVTAFDISPMDGRMAFEIREI